MAEEVAVANTTSSVPTSAPSAAQQHHHQQQQDPHSGGGRGGRAEPASGPSSPSLLVRKTRSKSAMNPSSNTLEDKQSSLFTREDIDNLKVSVAFWQGEAKQWRHAATDLQKQLEKACDLLIQHGIDPPFINAPLSPSMLFQRKKKGKKNKYDGILTLKDSKDKKKAKSSYGSDLAKGINVFLLPAAMRIMGSAPPPSATGEPDSISVFLQQLPNLDLSIADTKTLLASLSGPTPDGKDPALQSYKDIAAGMSVSTYPILGQLPNGDQTRAGDPNCDAFSLKFWKNRAIACVTDGCGWGNRSRNASHTANTVFVETVEEYMPNIMDLHSAAVVLLHAFHECHLKIIEGATTSWEVGTTTLCCSLLVQVKNEVANDNCPYALLCISVGDCKAYLVSKDNTSTVRSAPSAPIVSTPPSSPDTFASKLYQMGSSAPAVLSSSREIRRPVQRHITDLTSGNRRGDIRNAGGHLGPQSNDNNAMDANLGNLTLQYSPCRAGDMLLLMSDGIHDNFDPEALGKDPSHFGVEVPTWEGVPIEDYVLIKDSFRKTQLEKHIKSTLSPVDTVQAIFKYVDNLTEPTRKFMESNQVDHSTMISFIVN